jgi:hypothetical protein
MRFAANATDFKIKPPARTAPAATELDPAPPGTAPHHGQATGGRLANA